MNAASFLGLFMTILMAVLSSLSGSAGANGAAGALPGIGAAPLTLAGATGGPTSAPSSALLGGTIPTSFMPQPVNPAQTPGTVPGGQVNTGAAVASPSGPFVFPVPGGRFTNDFGVGTHAFGGSSVFNVGIDIFASRGTPIVAPVSGTLRQVGNAGMGGNRLHLIAADGTDYYFAHLDAFAAGIQDGVQVQPGQQLGTVGDTGNAKGTSPHLHFSAVKNGQPWNPFQVLTAARNTSNGTSVA